MKNMKKSTVIKLPGHRFNNAVPEKSNPLENDDDKKNNNEPKKQKSIGGPLKKYAFSTKHLILFAIIFAAIASYLIIRSMAETAPTFSVATPSNFHPFSSNSPWKVRVDSLATKVDPTSTTKMAYVQNIVKADVNLGGAGGYLGSAATIFVVDSRTTPLVPVYVNNPGWGNHIALDKLWRKGVPIPANAQGGRGGGEAHMAVYDSYTDTLYDFYMVCPPKPGSYTVVNGKQTCPHPSSPALPTGTWQAVYGGVIYNASKSPGYFQNRCKVGGILKLNPTPFPSICDANTVMEEYYLGSTGTSLPVAGGIITAAELQSGHINHALSMQLPFRPPTGHDSVCSAKLGTSPTPYVMPAQRGDGSSTLPDCTPEGAKIRLDPTLDLSTLHLPKETRAIAEAMQKYGAIVNDRTNNAVGISVEDPLTYILSDKFNPLTTAVGGAYEVDYLRRFRGGTYNGVNYDGFPWGKLQLVKMDVCKVSPCTPTLPNVSLTAPVADSKVTGKSVAISANASSSVSGIAGVQFRLDGKNLGAEDTTAPYGISWDSSKNTAGVHTLTAVTRDGAGSYRTSAGIKVTVVATRIISDAFNGTGSPNTIIWSSYTSDIRLDGIGRAVLPTTVIAPSTTSGTHTMTLRAANPLKGLSAFIDWRQIAIPSNGGRQVFFKIASSANPNAQWISIVEAGGSLVFHNYQYGDSATKVAYNATTMRFWRMRELGGTVFFQTSPDNATWTTLRTIATRDWMTSASRYQVGSSVYLTSGKSIIPSLVESFWLGYSQ
jgi:hypothetical protein